MLEPEKVNELHTQIQYRLVEKLTESERRYRSLVENLREIVFECDRTGKLTFINQAWTDTLGHPLNEVIGQNLAQFIDDQDVKKWHTALETEADCCLELRFYSKHRALFCLELAMRFIHANTLSGALIDITERKQAEIFLKETNEALEDRVRQRTIELSRTNQELQYTIQRLRQAQVQLIHKEKMSSLGQLVAGLAHEINNPVGFVHCNLEPAQAYAQDMLHLLELYQQHYPQPTQSIQDSLESYDFEFIKKDFPRLLTSMELGTERIRTIVNSLRNFSRLDESAIKQVDIHKGLDNTLLLLNHRFKKKAKIQLIKDYGDLPLITCFPEQLNQVFMNLLSNAIDVLLDAALLDSTVTPEPSITIRTRADHEFTLIEISDNGPGIPKDVLPRIFDPFFTTKPVGQGTGLGLSISHQIIVESHGGQLSCLSDAGAGTTFRIQLPLELPEAALRAVVPLSPSAPDQVADT